MYCSNCGLENLDEATYCVHCGSLFLRKDRQTSRIPFAQPDHTVRPVLSDQSAQASMQSSPPFDRGPEVERTVGFAGFPVFGVREDAVTDFGSGLNHASGFSHSADSAVGEASGSEAGFTADASDGDAETVSRTSGGEGPIDGATGETVSDSGAGENQPTLLSSVRQWMGKMFR